MKLTPEVCANALSRLQGVGKEHLRTVQHYFDRRHLEASLVSLLQAANGHEARGLAPGAALYLLLHRESQLLIAAYCDRWQISPDRLHAELPALAKLAELAQPRPPKATVSRVVFAVLAAFVMSLLIGLAGAFIRLGFHLLGGGR